MCPQADPGLKLLLNLPYSQKGSQPLRSILLVPTLVVDITYGLFAEQKKCRRDVELAYQIIFIIYFLGMCGWCCPICQVADSAQRLGESYLLYFVLGCFVPCVPVFLVRDKAREKYGLEGSTGKNHYISYFCVPFCTVYTNFISNFHESQ